MMATALAAFLATCGDEARPECKKPAECVGKPGANTCKIIGGHGRCVIGCTGGQDNFCPPPLKCTGTADDATNFCQS